MHALLNVAVMAARRAGSVLLRKQAHRDKLVIEQKGHNDFVSDADRAAEATVQADAKAAWTKRRAEKRPDAMPKGVEKVFEDGALPPGIRRQFGASEPEPQPDTNTDTGGCSEVVFPDGTVVCV